MFLSRIALCKHSLVTPLKRLKYPAAFKGAVCVSDKLGHVTVVIGSNGSGNLNCLLYVLFTYSKAFGGDLSVYNSDPLQVLIAVDKAAIRI